MAPQAVAGVRGALNMHRSEVSNEVYYVCQGQVVLELQAIKFENANFHAKMDFFHTFKFNLTLNHEG